MEGFLEEEVDIVNRRGLVTRRECENPSEAVVERLERASRESELARQRQLQEHYANGESSRVALAKKKGKTASDSHLFRRKRAKVLADILFAELHFRKFGLSEDACSAIHEMLKTKAGRRSLRIALHANKKTRIGSSIMELIVCGAIPPYNELLGGKLVAMLMASPQVVRDYRERYDAHVSEIATNLAGREITREARLVLLTTTSLYYAGSSQYERVSVPTQESLKLEYERLGLTEGYGSIVLRSQTAGALDRLYSEHFGMRRVNNVFGEGVSPRLRRMRDGLALVGIPQDLVLQHKCPRLVYGVRLAHNALEYLRGESRRPQYLFPLRDYKQGTSGIVDFWLSRWLRPRLQRVETKRKLREFRKEELLLSRELDGCNETQCAQES